MSDTTAVSGWFDMYCRAGGVYETMMLGGGMGYWNLGGA